MGRIVCDSEGHLNANSVLLEGTLQHSAGHSVKLDLSQLLAYRLFPGQVRSAGQLLFRPPYLSCTASDDCVSLELPCLA